MSKFIEALKTAAGFTQPMGFISPRSILAKPGFLIVASFSEVKVKHLAESAGEANARLFTSDLKSPQLKTAAESAGGIPWGCSLANAGSKMPALIKAGIDFITFTPAALLKTLPDSPIGRILEIDTESAEKLPRVINNSPVDAVYLVTTIGEEPLTWQHLMLVRNLTGMLTKPLLSSIPDMVTESELQALWDAGVVGIVTAAWSADNITNLRQLTDRLDYRSRLKPEGQDAVLPLGQPGQATVVTEADDDEDWE